MNQTRNRTQYDLNDCGEISNTTFIEYRATEFCDFCTPNMTNTSWTSWLNITCLVDDTMNQTRNRTEYDINFCGEIGNTTYIEYRATEFCDFCTPNMTNISTDWVNISCLVNDTMNQTRNTTQYDINFCGEVANTSFIEYRDTEYCDYCTPNLTNTSWTVWLNISCLQSYTMNETRNRTQYDLNNCSEIANFTYIEYRNISYCDWDNCSENWTVQYGSCLTNDSMVKYYIDLTFCNTTDGLHIDNGTYVYCNYCTEDITGPFYYPDYCRWNNQTKIKYYIDVDYDTCCGVTLLFSDCSIFYVPYLNTTVNCTYLQSELTVESESNPYLKERMDLIGYINTSPSTKCWSYVKKENEVLQTSPQRTAYSESLLFSKEEESREYFNVENGLVNAYYRKENLIPQETYVLGLRCVLENGTIITGEQYITPVYEDFRRVTARGVWGVQEIGLIIFIAFLVLIILILAVYAWKK